MVIIGLPSATIVFFDMLFKKWRFARFGDTFFNGSSFGELLLISGVAFYFPEFFSVFLLLGLLCPETLYFLFRCIKTCYS